MTETIARSTLLRRAAIGGAAVVAGGVAIGALPRIAGSAPSAAQDDRIMALALGLEQAQQALYEAADAAGILQGDLAAFVATALEQEAVHVRTIRAVAGGGGTPPTTDFAAALTDPDAFARAAIRLENITIQAYNGQVANLTPTPRAEWARVISVDARHAGWIRGIVGDRPAGQAVDSGAADAQTREALASIGIDLGGTP